MKWNEKCNDLNCVQKPTQSRLSLTHHANKSSGRWADKNMKWSESPWDQSGSRQFQVFSENTLFMRLSKLSSFSSTFEKWSYTTTSCMPATLHKGGIVFRGVCPCVCVCPCKQYFQNLRMKNLYNSVEYLSRWNRKVFRLQWCMTLGAT